MDDHDHAVAAVQARASRKSSQDFTVANSTRGREKPAPLDDRKYAQESEEHWEREGTNILDKQTVTREITDKQ